MERTRTKAIALLLAATALLAACGDNPAPPPAPPSGWVDVPGMTCADGSPTGIGVSPGMADRVLIFLDGGGACWDEAACAANRRSFGRAEFDRYSLLVSGTVLDRALDGNPFATWTLVFVPYCTGDVHVGDSVVSYGARGTWNHHGKRNLDAALDRVKALFASPEKVVVTGSSAGGFGSLLAFDLARERWPVSGLNPTQAYLVDDSGPTFVGDDLPPAIRDAWWQNWNLAATIGPVCATCEGDLSDIWTTLAADRAGDRLALLSTTEDATIRGYFGGMPPATFAAALGTLAAKLEAVGARSFRVGGDDRSRHPMLLAPADFVAGADPLLAWLGEMVNDDATWSSAGP